MKRLDFLYDKDAIKEENREEYLLGKRYEFSNQNSDMGKMEDASVAGADFLQEKSEIRSFMERQNKVHSDPMFRIEMEKQRKRKKILSNPGLMNKLKNRTQKKKKSKKKKKEKKKKKKKKKRKRSPSSSRSPSPVHKRRKIEHKKKKRRRSDSDSSSDSDHSSDSDSGHKRRKIERKKKTNRRSSDDSANTSDSDDDSDSNNDASKYRSSKKGFGFGLIHPRGKKSAALARTRDKEKKRKKKKKKKYYSSSSSDNENSQDTIQKITTSSNRVRYMHSKENAEKLRSLSAAEKEKLRTEMEEQANCQEDKRYQSILKNEKEFEMERQAHLNGKNLSSSSFIHEAHKNVLYETLEKRLERRLGRTQKGEFMESKFLDR